MNPQPDCVICRRQVCADHRTCAGELAALLARMNDHLFATHDELERRDVRGAA